MLDHEQSLGWTTQSEILWIQTLSRYQESVEDKGVTDGPKGNQVFLLDSDEAVKGWLMRTSHLVNRIVFIVYRHPEASGQPNTPISGVRPFYSCTALVSRASEVYYDISGGEDVELVVLQMEPRTFPWTESSLASVDHGLNRGGSPLFLGKNYHTTPNFLKLRSQLGIWIFMPHRSDVYEKVAVRLEESPPFL